MLERLPKIGHQPDPAKREDIDFLRFMTGKKHKNKESLTVYVFSELFRLENVQIILSVIKIN